MDGIDNRSTPLIRSHAQKHFIHLWTKGIPLPPKVQETGSGYTLSGEPLNPASGAARMYAKRGRGRAVVNYTANANHSRSSYSRSSYSTSWYGSGRRKLRFTTTTRARRKLAQKLKYPNRAGFYGMFVCFCFPFLQFVEFMRYGI